MLPRGPRDGLRPGTLSGSRLPDLSPLALRADMELPDAFRVPLVPVVPLPGLTLLVPLPGRGMRPVMLPATLRAPLPETCSGVAGMRMRPVCGAEAGAVRRCQVLRRPGVRGDCGTAWLGARSQGASSDTVDCAFAGALSLACGGEGSRPGSCMVHQGCPSACAAAASLWHRAQSSRMQSGRRGDCAECAAPARLWAAASALAGGTSAAGCGPRWWCGTTLGGQTLSPGAPTVHCARSRLLG